MNRFFKTYFIASLIYAVVFGLLVYSVGLLFSGFECFDIDADNEQYAEYCLRAAEMSAFEKVSLKFFFFPFLSVMLLSLVYRNTRIIATNRPVATRIRPRQTTVA